MEAPVAPVHTASYVGASSVPCVYPTEVATTPGSRMYASSSPQKQPPAKVAVSKAGGSSGSRAVSSRSSSSRQPARGWFVSSVSVSSYRASGSTVARKWWQMAS